MAGKVRLNGRVNSLSGLPGSPPVAPGCWPGGRPLAQFMNKHLPVGNAAAIKQQALIEHVLQARSFLGSQGMDRQVSEGKST